MNLLQPEPARPATPGWAGSATRAGCSQRTELRVHPHAQPAQSIRLGGHRHTYAHTQKATAMHDYDGTTTSNDSTLFVCSCGESHNKREMTLHLRLYSRDAVRSFIQAYKKAGF